MTGATAGVRPFKRKMIFLIISKGVPLVNTKIRSNAEIFMLSASSFSSWFHELQSCAKEAQKRCVHLYASRVHGRATTRISFD